MAIHIKDKWRSRIENVIEYILALMFVQGGVRTLLLAEPVVAAGALYVLVGPIAIYIYGGVFLGTGLLLVWAKVRKHRRLHKGTLMAMYLIALYVLILSVALNGLAFRQLTTILVGLAAAYLWVRWKFRTEYIQEPKTNSKE